MGFINFIAELLKDPRTAIASWIAAGPLMAYGTFVPFIAGMGGMHWRNFVIFNVLGGITWSTLFTLLGYFFGGIPFVQEHFELLIVGIVAVSIIPTVVGLVKAKLGKKNA